MPNLIKKLIVSQLAGDFENAEGMIIVSLSGLTVQETETLRSALAEEGVRLRMVRNRLARRALKERGIEPEPEMFSGSIAMTSGASEEAIHAAKVLHKSQARKDGKVALKGGFFEGNLIGADEAKALAELPTQDELRAQMLSAISGPARMLVGLLAAPSGSLARVLQARVDAGGEAAADA